VNNFTLWNLSRAFVFGLIGFGSASSLAKQPGELLYEKCIACHSFGYNRTGPNHCDLIGRVAGTADDFIYTQAMRSSKIVWTVENLDLFLAAPLEIVPGTSMGFIADADQRSLLIAYIQTQRDSEDCN
ncbi:MAG: hypothetical protein JKX81_12195, partial [Arenicella sp.]|nr:hypothetical protein [Arenicella sp.]